MRLYWRQRGGMVPGSIPDADRVDDQAAWLQSAFAIIAAAEGAVNAAERGGEQVWSPRGGSVG